MNEPARSKRFIVEERQRDDDSYMYSYTSYTYLVISVETGDELMRFGGSVDSDSSGTRSSGASQVEIIDEAEVSVTNHDASVEVHELPTELRTSDDGHRLFLRYADGRTEERPRNQPMFCSKFGEWFAAGELVNPPPPPEPARPPKRAKSAKRRPRSAR